MARIKIKIITGFRTPQKRGRKIVLGVITHKVTLDSFSVFSRDFWSVLDFVMECNKYVYVIYIYWLYIYSWKLIESYHEKG